jgi:hypothetical protein
MSFNPNKTIILELFLLMGLMLSIGCSGDGDADLLSQQFQAHRSEVVSIELASTTEEVLRTNQSIQFEVYGLLADGSRIQSVADENGVTTDLVINDWVSWSVDNNALAQVSDLGLLTGVEGTGTVTVIASFVDQQATADIVVTDAELVEVLIIAELTDVEVCRNLSFSAAGVLADGNQVTLNTASLIWKTDAESAESGVAEFKDDAQGILSTYSVGSLSITAQDRLSEIISTPLDLVINGNLAAISLSNTVENTMSPGESISISATGSYPDGDFDITENTLFISRDEDRATFENNILTAETDAELGEVEITGSCDLLVAESAIEILDSSR